MSIKEQATNKNSNVQSYCAVTTCWECQILLRCDHVLGMSDPVALWPRAGNVRSCCAVTSCWECQISCFGHRGKSPYSQTITNEIVHLVKATGEQARHRKIPEDGKCCATVSLMGRVGLKNRTGRPTVFVSFVFKISVIYVVYKTLSNFFQDGYIHKESLTVHIQVRNEPWISLTRSK
jgi:hypothetical protein